ncbi:MAG: hypothetical protein K0S07_508 [Chlamydiales bacterium]|jgi:biopolymer transport protein ExbD|nr:hypothetical protein [Chlamydiales bacterium]
MRRFRFKPDAIEEPQINLTPMIDVSFVVLIMFIVIAPILEFEKVDLAQRGGVEKVSSFKDSGISIVITADNRILYHQKNVSLNELFLLLKEAHQKNPNGVPCLFPDRKAPFGTYQAIKNSVEMAGFAEMQVVLEP